jgi:hypothetical protein
MRDRTRSRNYSASRDEFRREHERHRAWGLTQRHARKLRRLREGSLQSPATTPDAPTVPAPHPHRTRPPDPTPGEPSQRPPSAEEQPQPQPPKPPTDQARRPLNNRPAPRTPPRLAATQSDHPRLAGQTSRVPTQAQRPPHDRPSNHTSRPDRIPTQARDSRDDRPRNETSRPDRAITQSRRPRGARAPHEMRAPKSASPEGSHLPRDDRNWRSRVRPRSAADAQPGLSSSPGVDSHAGRGGRDRAGDSPDQLQPPADRHHGAAGSCRTPPAGSTGPFIAESTIPIPPPADDGAPPNPVERRREPPAPICQPRSVARDRTAPSGVRDPPTMDTTYPRRRLVAAPRWGENGRHMVRSRTLSYVGESAF